jgi:hypothetical protein
MENDTFAKEIRFEDLRPTADIAQVPAWAMQSQTSLAHGSGRLPTKLAQIGWQPLAGPGSAPVQRSMTRSMRLLHERIVRGEA